MNAWWCNAKGQRCSKALHNGCCELKECIYNFPDEEPQTDLPTELIINGVVYVKKRSESE